MSGKLIIYNMLPNCKYFSLRDYWSDSNKIVCGLIMCTSREESHQCVCDLYEIYDNNFNYYHYQPGSNIVIVYCKYITHARMHTRIRAYTHARGRTHTPPSPFMLSLFDGSVAPNHDGVNTHFRMFTALI